MNVYALSKKDIEQIADCDEIITVVEQAFADHALGKTVIPPVTNLDIEESNGEVHIKSCHIKGYENYCIKIASGFYDNAKSGLPTGNGMMALFSAGTGELSALLFDRGLLTDLRTAAAGAVAARHLAKETPLSAGVIGTGIQARMQIEFLMHVREVKSVFVWGRSEAAVAGYINDMTSQFPGMPVTSCDTPAEVAESADVLITATPSRSPLITANDLHPGLHITALGSDGPDKQEIDAQVFARLDKIVVDHTDQCARLGELHHALDRGVVTHENIHAELGGIVTGKKPGREHDSEITLCDLTGVGVQDTAVANWALSKAKALDIGSFISI